MKIVIDMAVDLDHACPIEQGDMFDAYVETTENDCEKKEVITKMNHFDLVNTTKVTNDGVVRYSTWTIWNYNSLSNKRNSVSFNADARDDEMFNISFITGLNVKDIEKIFEALKEMRDGLKLHLEIPDPDLEAN